MTTQEADWERDGAGALPPAPPVVAPSPPPPVRSAAAPRRTNSRLLILAVGAVLLSGVVALFAGQSLTRHSQVLAIARQVQVGSHLSADDLVAANVTSDPHLSPVMASDEQQVIGLVAQVPLAPGELLTRNAIGAGTGFTAGEVLVALAVKPGQFPERGLTTGQHVLVVATAGANGGTAPAAAVDPSPAAGASTPAMPGTVTATTGYPATVAEVGAADVASQDTVVDVRVAAGQGAVVANLASTSNVAIILLPAGS